MKKHLLPVMVLISGCCFAQSNSTTSGYQLLQGTIGSYSVTLHLHRIGHTYAGYYYYNHSQQLITVSGDDTTKKGPIFLYAFAPASEDNETFTFSLNDGNASGEWRRKPDSRPLPFSAHPYGGDSALSFDYVYTYGTARLKPSLPQSPEATYESGTVWPKGRTADAPFVKAIISHMMGLKTVPDEIGKTLIDEKQKFLSGYQQEHKTATLADIKEMPSAYSSDLTERILVAFQSPALLTLAHTTYTYTGGAHGMHGTSYTVIDRLHQKKLLLPDVINEKGRAILNKLLAKQFRKAYGLKETDSLTEGGLFENHIKPNDNFYLTQKGIGFLYQPYEIGPYALGEVDVFIPFSALAEYLQPSFKKLVQ